MKKLFSEVGSDFSSGLVVFFVSVPLCLGIALASGAPLTAGLISGIVGGVICGALSRSPLAITGPAAGMTAVVLYAKAELGSFEALLLATVLAGMIQFSFGLLRLGAIARFFPASVVKGLLAGIGLILIFKQLPHALGYDQESLGAESFLQLDQQNTLSELWLAAEHIHPGAVFIALATLGIILAGSSQAWQRGAITKYLPAVLVGVVASIVINELFFVSAPDLALTESHRVTLPHVSTWLGHLDAIPFLDFTPEFLGRLLIVALTIAVVASIESLLNVEAVDKMDTFRRITPLNRELIAQGTTNIASGLLGGLPVTVVIARSSLNAYSGARSRLAAIVQGLMLAIAVLLFPGALERIPLSGLAVILMFTGYRLTAPKRWKLVYSKGKDQFIPFAVTAVVIFFSNLLIGILSGVAVALFFVMKANFRTGIVRVNRGNHHLVKFTKDVSFVNKAVLFRILEEIPADSMVSIDGTRSYFIDQDIIETIEDFQRSAPTRGISVEIVQKAFAIHPFFKTKSN
jgi:MFS superfamily sulfate permease-like transporter